MSDYKLSGVHPIRRLLWSLAKNELGWDEKNYSLKDGSVRGLVPIVTPQQQPELNAVNRPYMVYNYITQSKTTDYWLNEEQATFAVYSDDEEDIRSVNNLVNKYFSMYDVSADYMNWWINDHGSAAYKAFNFKWIRVVSTIGAGPSEEEGGRQDGVITLRYQYTTNDILMQPEEDRFRPLA